MIRRVSLCALAALLLLATLAAAAPVRLARTPDYHAGKIAFSYLGDIWVVNEDGSNPQRITDNTAREVNPRFSPDGQRIAFSSNRYGNYDVFVVQATGGVPRRLTYHTGDDQVVGWSPNSQNIVFRSSHGDGSFPGTATLYQISVEGGPEKPMPVDWGWWGSYSTDGKQFLFNRHPAVWSRKHYRGSYAADIWVADLAAKSYKQVLAGENYNRYWPMMDAKGDIYFVADPLPNDKSVKPGSAEVRKSVNNIYKIAASARPGTAPAPVTKFTDGNLYFPSMSSDGKVIVFEENFGLWKLDVASGRTTEVKVDINVDEKENEFEIVQITNDADSFDLSPSGRRAVISTRNQIYTIATDRGDITVIANDKGASRNDLPKWSPDGKYIAFVSDRSGRQEVYLVDQDGKNLKKITDIDSDKSALTWSPDSKNLALGSSDNKLYLFSVADSKTSVIASSTISTPRGLAFSPDSKWVTFTKEDRTGRSHVYIAPATGGEERHITDDSHAFSETSAVWTADSRFIVYITSAGTGSRMAATGQIGAQTQVQLMVLPLRALDRDPLNRDIDNEAQGLAAEPAGGRGGGGGARGGGGGGGGGGGAAAAAAPPVTVTIDWDGLADRARRLTTPGDTVGGLTPAPTGSVIAFTSASAGGGGGGARGGDGATSTSGTYTINVADGTGLTRIPPAPTPPAAAGGRGPGAPRGGGGGGFGGGMVFTRDGRTLYFRSGRGIYAATIGGAGGGAAAAAPAATGGGGGRGGSAAAATAAAPATTGASARQVTFTINMEIDHKALRKEVFEEGWRVMKNRFYDKDMHGADWNGAKATYGALLPNLVDQEELHTVMMQMIGELNASHTGVSGGIADVERSPVQTRYPGFELEADSSGYYRVGHIWKDGPVDHEYVKIHKGDYIISVDERELKTTDNYWQYFTFAPGRKFHFTINSKPLKDGAWDVAIEPMAGTALTNAQYAKWVEDRRAMVNKLSNGEIGYLHIRAMDAASLRQFTLDLAMYRDKKAFIIDQRFNGGGGIDQELIALLVGQKYQYTVSRGSDLQAPRPSETFYGPMVVMQNERSASDAEMFPQAFKDLKLGKTVGVPTYGAVIGTGSFTLADGSSIRTPGSGVWTATGENLENLGVKPDVHVDNTPEDFAKGRDAQIEKAVELLKADIAAGKLKKGV